MEKICLYCKNSFTANRKDKMYCCRNCKQHASERRTGRRKRSHVKTVRPFLKFKKERCECCGFIPVNTCQLDVDHIDGDHYYNDINNLQTLCANCHRLKTYLNRDWECK